MARKKDYGLLASVHVLEYGNVGYVKCPVCGKHLDFVHKADKTLCVCDDDRNVHINDVVKCRNKVCRQMFLIC